MLKSRLLALTALVCVPAAMLVHPAAAQEKKKVTSAADLPVYNYQLAAPPSEMLGGPKDRVIALADAIMADNAKTMAEYDVTDLSTREQMIGLRIAAAQLRRDVPAVKAAVAELRAIQERADRKLTSGLLAEIVAESCVAADPGATAARLVTERAGKLPWDQTDTWMKQTAAGLSTANPAVVTGAFKQQIDPVAAANGNKVNAGLAASIVSARAGLECTLPVAANMAGALDAIVKRQMAAAPAAADIWKDRDIALAPSMKATPVTIGIWDSGVDMKLFRAAGGYAVDGQGKPMADALLRPLGEYEGRTEELMNLVKGALDLQAGQTTPEAAAYQAKMRGLKPEEVKAFSEATGFIANYIHGTHVAGIATAGNPFASVYAVAQHWPVKQEEFRLNREISESRAAFYREAVKKMQAAGVRVVNMSWRVGPAMFETFLQLQGGMPDAAERKRVAAELFAIEKAALEAAIKSAPDILFVAGAGNEANDANFANYIPAGITAPNLLTVGAVDRAGREALFTSIGGTVAVYANGVEVESYFPGGQRRILSGTSMASPQVANVAAKLVAMKPELTGAQLRQILVDTAEQQGRVKLMNPKAAFAKAGVKI